MKIVLCKKYGVQPAVQICLELNTCRVVTERVKKCLQILVDRRVSLRWFGPNAPEIITFRQISVELSKIEFHENAFSCSRQTDTHTNSYFNGASIEMRMSQ
jgi:hypothetical protein